MEAGQFPHKTTLLSLWRAHLGVLMDVAFVQCTCNCVQCKLELYSFVIKTLSAIRNKLGSNKKGKGNSPIYSTQLINVMSNNIAIGLLYFHLLLLDPCFHTLLPSRLYTTNFS